MHDHTGKEQQFQHAYEVTGRGRRISRVRSIRSNMPTTYQVGLQDLTVWQLQIVNAYYVSGVDFRIWWVQNTRLNVSTMYQLWAAGYQGFGTSDGTCLRGIRIGHAISLCKDGKANGNRIILAISFVSLMETRCPFLNDILHYGYIIQSSLTVIIIHPDKLTLLYNLIIWMVFLNLWAQ